MVKPLDGISRASPVSKNIVIPMESVDPAPPVVHQPVAVNHVAPIAPAVAVNNVAQGLWCGLEKKDVIFAGAIIGEGAIGFVCTSGGLIGAVLTLDHMGATAAVTAGTVVGVTVGGLLCTAGAIVATAVAYPLS